MVDDFRRYVAPAAMVAAALPIVMLAGGCEKRVEKRDGVDVTVFDFSGKGGKKGTEEKKDAPKAEPTAEEKEATEKADAIKKALAPRGELPGDLEKDYTATEIKAGGKKYGEIRTHKTTGIKYLQIEDPSVPIVFNNSNRSFTIGKAIIELGDTAPFWGISMPDTTAKFDLTIVGSTRGISTNQAEQKLNLAEGQAGKIRYLLPKDYSAGLEKIERKYNGKGFDEEVTPPTLLQLAERAIDSEKGVAFPLIAVSGRGEGAGKVDVEIPQVLGEKLKLNKRETGLKKDDRLLEAVGRNPDHTLPLLVMQTPRVVGSDIVSVKFASHNEKNHVVKDTNPDGEFVTDKTVRGKNEVIAIENINPSLDPDARAAVRDAADKVRQTNSKEDQLTRGLSK